ncbi:MAG: indole-3-glycerol phosphate synthase TrpC [Candidatus Eiseniibacteriota bacterium]
MNGRGADFLARVAGDRARRVAQMSLATPPHVLRERLPEVRPAGRLERALRRRPQSAPLKMLCEIKRASPSRGLLRGDLDPVEMALLYQRGGAAAISIVTEPDHFLGELEWINAVRARVELPILLKDFIVDPWQILDAAVRGADGVLLIAALLSETVLQRRITEARLLGLDCLVEVHSLPELEASIRAGATLIGINHRDLRTLEVRLETSLDLLPHVPPLLATVAESGLSRPEQLARLRETRCDAVLMGEVFMTSEDPAAVLSQLAAAARG